MDRLDQLIKECRQYRSKECVEMFDLLTELKQCRESDLRPADKFLGNTVKEQFNHMESELNEIMNEIWGCEEISKNKLVMEIIDLQMSAETMLAILGLDEQQRREARKKVIDKNEKRGYYEK